jgi:hypothetical protein
MSLVESLFNISYLIKKLVLLSFIRKLALVSFVRNGGFEIFGFCVYLQQPDFSSHANTLNHNFRSSSQFPPASCVGCERSGSISRHSTLTNLLAKISTLYLYLASQNNLQSICRSSTTQTTYQPYQKS